jgi:carbamoyltransferase
MSSDILGINMGHDSSVVLTDSRGTIIYAVGEERFNRIKNYAGFPALALADLLERHPQAMSSDHVVCGNNGLLNLGRSTVLIRNMYNSPESWMRPGEPWTSPQPPGWQHWDPANLGPLNDETAPLALKEVFESRLKDFGVGASANFVIHHDAHAASAFAPSGFERSLVISLDGQGDGESGLIGIGDRSRGMQILSRIPSAHSVGHVYSAVTDRYGLRTNRHEGKITGLAAYGKHSAAVDVLQNVLTIVDGVPKVSIDIQGLSDEMERTLRGLGWGTTHFLEQFFRVAETGDFADLAFAVQTVVEDAIWEMTNYWVERTGIQDVALAGGVFANVRVNQKIAESIYPGRVYIYPNMGDGGLAAGGVWHWIQSQGKLLAENPHEQMLSGPIPSTKLSSSDLLGVTRVPLPEGEEPVFIARLLANRLIVGVIDGQIENGPRALGNRSLLADPRQADLNDTLNGRLRRTEYMPFAPMVLEEHFADVFDTSRHGSLTPFLYMTMVCPVKPEWRQRIPAVTHIDGSARPQLLTPNMYPFAYSITKAFYEITGIPCLVNTSFNVHEEPIVLDLAQGLKALRTLACDVVISGGYAYCVAGNEEVLGVTHIS